MTLSDEKLMAFIDNLLPPDEMRAAQDLIAKDPKLSAYVEKQKALNTVLGNAFDPVLSEPVPAGIMRALQKTAPISAARTKSRFSIASLIGLWTSERLWLPLGGALVASAIFAVIIVGSPSNAVLQSENGKLVAQGVLAEALSAKLAADTLSDTQARIAVSFLSKDGRYCRTFVTEGDRDALAGIACRENTQWRIAALSATEKSMDGAFQPAGAALPAPVRDAVAVMIANAPLDADAERAARDKGWQPAQ